MSAGLESLGGGRYRISGQLTFSTARELLVAARAQFPSESPVEIDLQDVSAADSAGLALLIEWYLGGTQTDQKIRFVNVPQQLRALAKISDLENLLSLNGAA